MAGGRPARPEADGLVLRGDRRRVRGRAEGPARRARADHAELDRLALHVRRELHAEVQPQPRPHLLLRRPTRSRFTFNADAVRVPSARQTTYADRRANPLGKLPDDTWVLRPQEDGRLFRPEDDTWYVSRVCGTFKERGEHPCQMPEAVLERIVRVASNPGDLVLDPFAGSGTTLAAAKKLGRDYYGIELSENYVERIKDRLGRVVVDEDVIVGRAKVKAARR